MSNRPRRFIPQSCWSILIMLCLVGMMFHVVSYHLRYPDMTDTRLAMQAGYSIPILIMGAALLFAAIMKDWQK